VNSETYERHVLFWAPISEKYGQSPKTWGRSGTILYESRTHLFVKHDLSFDFDEGFICGYSWGQDNRLLPDNILMVPRSQIYSRTE